MRLPLHVKPSSNKRKITYDSDVGWIVFLKSPPDKGKANKELLKLFKSKLKCNTYILRGHKSQNKILEIEEEILFEDLKRLLTDS